jgi:hypothetical protein
MCALLPPLQDKKHRRADKRLEGDEDDIDALLQKFAIEVWGLGLDGVCEGGGEWHLRVHHRWAICYGTASHAGGPMQEEMSSKGGRG